MKTKPLTFLFSLTFLFLFSGSSSAGFFSPDDYSECIFKNMEDAQSDMAAISIHEACYSKFPEEPPKGASGLFGPKNYGDCLLKYSKGIKDIISQMYINSASENHRGFW